MRRQFLEQRRFVLLACASVFAQGTNGTISGRVVDEQGAAVPGATVTAKSATTGFTRSEVSDTEGVYRLSALPVGIYDVTAELQGFTTVSKKGVEVNVGQNQARRLPAEGRAAGRDGQRDRRDAADPDHRFVGRRGRRREAHRVDAAQRPPVREPRGDGAGRRPQLPFATRPRARSTRRWSTAAPAGTSTTRSTAATTTTTPSAVRCSRSRSRRSSSSTSRRSASRPSTAAATAACSAS